MIFFVNHSTPPRKKKTTISYDSITLKKLSTQISQPNSSQETFFHFFHAHHWAFRDNLWILFQSEYLHLKYFQPISIYTSVRSVRIDSYQKKNCVVFYFLPVSSLAAFPRAFVPCTQSCPLLCSWRLWRIDNSVLEQRCQRWLAELKDMTGPWTPSHPEKAADFCISGILFRSSFWIPEFCSLHTVR